MDIMRHIALVSVHPTSTTTTTTTIMADTTYGASFRPSDISAEDRDRYLNLPTDEEAARPNTAVSSLHEVERCFSRNTHGEPCGRPSTTTIWPSFSDDEMTLRYSEKEHESRNRAPKPPRRAKVKGLRIWNSLRTTGHDSPPPPPSPPVSRKQEDLSATDATDWDGPDDPANARNWPRGKKILHSIIPANIALLCTLGGSIITPGSASMMRDFGLSREVALLPYVLYILGLAFGPMVSAPSSETFGRRAVFFTGMPLFALFTVGAGCSTHVAGLLICRFLAGFCASAGLTIGSATVSDVWAPHERAVPMAFYVSCPFLGPAIGPLVGGFAAQAFGWRWTMWVLLFFTIVCMAPVPFMSETYKSAILKRRAKQRGAEYPSQPVATFVQSTLTRPAHMFCVEPVVACFTTYIAFNMGMMNAFFAAYPYVFKTTYGFDIGAVGLTFIALGVGVCIGCLIIVVVSRATHRRQMAQAAGSDGKIIPESRLPLAMIGSVLLPISLFWFGWSAQTRVHWMCPVAAEAMFGCGNLLIFMAAVMYVMDFYGPLYGASAMAANNMARYLLSAVIPLFIVQMYEGLGVGWASSLLGFVSLAMMPVPWVCWKWGHKLRERSQYAQR
jgi:multidrug resistance protein